MLYKPAFVHAFLPSIKRDNADGVSVHRLLYKQKQHLLCFNKYVTVDLHFFPRTDMAK